MSDEMTHPVLYELKDLSNERILSLKIEAYNPIGLPAKSVTLLCLRGTLVKGALFICAPNTPVLQSLTTNKPSHVYF